MTLLDELKENDSKFSKCSKKDRVLAAAALTLDRTHLTGSWECRVIHLETGTAGVCFYNISEIRLDKTFVELASIDILFDILLHEAAHAIVGNTHSHDDVWRDKAIMLGCDGEECRTMESLPEELQEHLNHMKPITALKNTICIKCTLFLDILRIML